MDKKYIISKLSDAITNNIGDFGRNQYILKRIKEKNTLFESDKKYLERILELDSTEIKKDKRNDTLKKELSVFLNPSLVKCSLCNRDIQLNEKSTRQGKEWFHLDCFSILSKVQVEKSHKKNTYERVEKLSNVPSRIKKDPVQIALTASIFIFLIVAAYFLLGPISMIAMAPFEQMCI